MKTKGTRKKKKIKRQISKERKETPSIKLFDGKNEPPSIYELNPRKNRSIFETELEKVKKLDKAEMLEKLRGLHSTASKDLTGEMQVKWRQASAISFSSLSTWADLTAEELRKAYAEIVSTMKTESSNKLIKSADLQYRKRLTGRQKGRAYKSFSNH